MNEILAIVLAWLIAAALIRTLRFKGFGMKLYPLAVVIFFQNPNRFLERALLRLRGFEETLRMTEKFMPPIMFSSYITLALFMYQLIRGSGFLVDMLRIHVPLSSVGLLMVGLSLLLVILPHEFFHALASAKNGIAVRRIGLFFVFPVIFGGFVELSEKLQLVRRVQRRKRIGVKRKLVKPKRKIPQTGRSFRRLSAAVREISSAGIMANIALALVLMLILVAAIPMFEPLYEKKGIVTLEPIKAENGLLPAGTVIYAINGTQLQGVEDFIELIYQAPENASLELTTSKGVFLVRKAVMLESTVVEHFAPKAPGLPPLEYVLLFVKLSISFNILAVLLNATPAFFTDGANYLAVLLREKVKSPRRAERIYYVLNSIGISMLVAAIFLVFSGGVKAWPH